MDLIVLQSNSECPVVCFIIYDVIWLNGSFLVAGVTLGHSSLDVVYRANSIFLRSLTGQ